MVETPIMVAQLTPPTMGNAPPVSAVSARSPSPTRRAITSPRNTPPMIALKSTRQIPGPFRTHVSSISFAVTLAIAFLLIRSGISLLVRERPRPLVARPPSLHSPGDGPDRLVGDRRQGDGSMPRPGSRRALTAPLLPRRAPPFLLLARPTVLRSQGPSPCRA